MQSRQKVALDIQQVDMSCNNVRRDFWAESVNIQVYLCFQLQRLHVDIFQFFIVLSYILEILLKWSAI